AGSSWFMLGVKSRIFVVPFSSSVFNVLGPLALPVASISVPIPPLRFCVLVPFSCG
ncbi:Uncharacterized protein APZ42_001933, partial [Daphnia magna]